MPYRRYAAFKPAAPYFDLVRGALGGLVDGEPFFDVVADDSDSPTHGEQDMSV